LHWRQTVAIRVDSIAYILCGAGQPFRPHTDVFDHCNLFYKNLMYNYVSPQYNRVLYCGITVTNTNALITLTCRQTSHGLWGSTGLKIPFTPTFFGGRFLPVR